MDMASLEHYKYEVERFRELLHEAINSKDAERILNTSRELDELIVQYMQMANEK